MRLLDARTFKFECFYKNIPAYAILSHRWSGDNEASFRDIESGRHNGASAKIHGFASYVITHFPQLQWIWVDSCCINQDNSMELSEGVNIMFEWYRNAAICVAYLADVEKAKNMTSFRNSVWHKRGWTLQELLASRLVLFCTSSWEVIGHKGDARLLGTGSRIQPGPNLETLISSVSGIPRGVVRDFDNSRALSVEDRLEWIRGRQTLREEDMVYALFGIFGVCPGANYGEKISGAQRRLFDAIELRQRHPGEIQRHWQAHAMLSSQTLHGPAVSHRSDAVLRPGVWSAEQKRRLEDMSTRARRHRQQSRMDEAVSLQEEVLQSSRGLQGEDQLYTFDAMLDLGMLYHQQNRLLEAGRMKEQALVGQVDVLGNDHPTTLATLSSLAQTYRLDGRLDDAERADLAVWHGRRLTLGSDDQSTLTAMSRLVCTYLAQARFIDAEQLQVELIQCRAQTVGERHPVYFSAMFDLVQNYVEQRRYDEALATARTCLNGQRQSLGGNHYDTLETIALIQDLSGRMRQAGFSVQPGGNAGAESKGLVGQSRASAAVTPAKAPGKRRWFGLGKSRS